MSVKNDFFFILFQMNKRVVPVFDQTTRIKSGTRVTCWTKSPSLNLICCSIAANVGNPN